MKPNILVMQPRFEKNFITQVWKEVKHMPYRFHFSSTTSSCVGRKYKYVMSIFLVALENAYIGAWHVALILVKVFHSKKMEKKKHIYVMSFLLARIGDAHMRSYWLDLSNPAHKILYKFGLSARGKTELEILKKLSHGSANAYELKRKRLRDIDVHYSTVLRALRRLEEKKLIRVVSQIDVGRRRKTYACTLVGELVVALARNGMSGAARIIAENSKSFRECIGAHLSFDSEYPSWMTELTIWDIFYSERGETAVHSDLDVYVRNTELEWVKASIVRALFHDSSRLDFDNRYYDPLYQPDFGDRHHHPLSRPEILDYLKRITHVNWIADWVAQVIEKYLEKENEWLQTLKDFMREVELARAREESVKHE